MICEPVRIVNEWEISAPLSGYGVEDMDSPIYPAPPVTIIRYVVYKSTRCWEEWDEKMSENTLRGSEDGAMGK